MNIKIGLCAGALVTVGIVSGIISFSASGSTDTPATIEVAAAPPVPHQAIAGVNPGAAATNKSGYKQAPGLTPMKLTPAQQYAATHPSDLALLGGGGCTVGYGGKHQVCLPITPPAAGAMDMTVQEMPWTCKQVLPLLPNGIPLNHKGVDPAHLDSNSDGIACDKGDT